MIFRRPWLTAAELKIQKLMIYSTDQPSWVALELMPGYLLSLKDALGRPPIAESRCYTPFLKRDLTISERISKSSACIDFLGKRKLSVPTNET